MFEKKVRCAFCGRAESEVEHMVTANGVSICSDCAKMALESMQGTTPLTQKADDEQPAVQEVKPLPKPQEIFEKLDQYVIGQTKAKRTLHPA